MPTVEAEVTAAGDELESAWGFCIVHLPADVDPERVILPEGVDWIHHELFTAAERPGYFVNHLETKP